MSLILVVVDIYICVLSNLIGKNLDLLMLGIGPNNNNNVICAFNRLNFSESFALLDQHTFHHILCVLLSEDSSKVWCLNSVKVTTFV